MSHYPRLKDLRKDGDFNQEDIAKVLQTTQQQYSKYERGVQEIPSYRLSILADFYNTSVDYIMGLSDIK